MRNFIDLITKLTTPSKSTGLFESNGQIPISRKPLMRSLAEASLAEKAPPGQKAERFINNNKEDFKNRYGKKWKKILYATAWKKFG